MPIRLIVADDHPIVLDGLAGLFRAADEFAVVATATNGQAALAAIRAHRPDVAVLDIRMPERNGLEVAAEIFRERIPTRVVLLSVAIDDDHTIEAVRLGVHGIVLKEMATRLLVQCVRKVHAGGYWVEQDSLRRAMEGLLRREATLQSTDAATLTATEIRVVELLAGGARNKEIADRLNVSEATVKNHLHNIYVKLKLSSRRELARWYEEARRREGTATR